MKVLYFGPLREAGHFMYSAGGSKASEKQEREVPWRNIDGVLQPNCKFKFMSWDYGRENEGEAILHYRDGWTALCFWDRSIDRRGACNSNFFIDQHLGFEEMVTASGDPYIGEMKRCVACGLIIGCWCGQWVDLDSWSILAIRDGKKLLE